MVEPVPFIVDTRGMAPPYPRDLRFRGALSVGASPGALLTCDAVSAGKDARGPRPDRADSVSWICTVIEN
jgi:hypothetical protein